MFHRINQKFEYFLKKEINELYLTHAIRSFAVSTIAIFIPIFFLQKNYSLVEVMIYFLVHSFLSVFLCYGALKFTSQKGVKHSIVLSIPLLIFYFLGLYNTDYLLLLYNKMLVLIIFALIASISDAFYWMGFNVDFASVSKKESSSKQIGIIQALGILFSIIGPLFGAFMISLFSFQKLFIIIISCLCISIIPLFFSGEVHEPFTFNIKSFLSKINVKKNLPYFAEGVRDFGARIFWPVLLYILAIKLTEMGGLFTISNAITAFFTYYVGKKITELNKKKFLNIGAITHSLTMIIRTIVKSISYIAIVQGFGALTYSLLNIPFQTSFYNNSKKRGISNIIFAREATLNIARFFTTAALVALLFLLKEKSALIIMIIIGGIFTLFMTWIKDE
ncbi:MAG: hypothetical protein KKC26_01895 [Nanoarchaeota archaeon]|nr:hypothetical protein [Nanoarchaeota archaeon]MBU1849381.1 hypothetical protein [Nanoarchaeota archaeon]